MCVLELRLQQLCVYASQRRLCIAAAVATAFQEVEEGLLMLARPKPKSIAADLAPAPKVSWLLQVPLLSTKALAVQIFAELAALDSPYIRLRSWILGFRLPTLPYCAHASFSPCWEPMCSKSCLQL